MLWMKIHSLAHHCDGLVTGQKLNFHDLLCHLNHGGGRLRQRIFPPVHVVELCHHEGRRQLALVGGQGLGWDACDLKFAHKVVLEPVVSSLVDCDLAVFDRTESSVGPVLVAGLLLTKNGISDC